MPVDDLYDIVRGCADCFKNGRCPERILGVGKDSNAILMVVTSEPSESKSKWGRSIGEEHIDVFNKLLGELRLKPEQVFVTCCVKCAGGSLAACKRFLDAEIEAVNPKHVITFGLQAFRVVTGLEAWVPGKEEMMEAYKLTPMLDLGTVITNPKYERYFLNSAKAIKKNLAQPNLDWW